MWNHRANWGKHQGFLLKDGTIFMYNSIFRSILAIIEVLNQEDEYTSIIMRGHYKLFNLSTGEFFDENIRRWIAL